MKKTNGNRFSMKMRAFYVSSSIIFLYQCFNVFFMGGIKEIFIANTWAVVTLGMAAITGKVVDDWQRGLNYKPELNT